MNSTLWACPVCQQILQPDERQYRCEQGHVFDIAKEGYVNLLLSHQRHSANPGDNKQMLRNRREFLQRGYYRKLAERLATLISEDCQRAGTADYTLLDTGCGEGYYIGLIARALTSHGKNRQLRLAGSDISKEAIRMAARRYRQIAFAVASSMSLPIRDHSIDCMLRVFAPGHDHEITRTLKPGGLFIRVSPGERHLHALRQLIYDQPREHDAEIVILNGLKHWQRIPLDFEVQVQGDDVPRLLAMTPYYWQASKDRQIHIETLDVLNCEISFNLDLYRSTVAQGIIDNDVSG